VFHTKNEDLSGKVWEGIIKYSVGAVLEIPDATPDQRLMVWIHYTKVGGLLESCDGSCEGCHDLL